MADYTSLDKVKSMFRKLDTSKANSAVTDSEITIWIDETEAEINSKLNRFYTVPILVDVSPVSNAILSKVATLKVAHLVRGVLDSIGQTSSEEKSINFDQQAEKILSECCPTQSSDGAWKDAKKDLYDATKKTIGPVNDSTFRASRNSGTEGPHFKKGVDSW